MRKHGIIMGMTKRYLMDDEPTASSEALTQVLPQNLEIGAGVHIPTRTDGSALNGQLILRVAPEHAVTIASEVLESQADLTS